MKWNTNRFKVVYHDEYDYELDYITDHNQRMHIEDICELLNSLYEENEHLKERIKELEKSTIVRLVKEC